MFNLIFPRLKLKVFCIFVQQSFLLKKYAVIVPGLPKIIHAEIL